MSYYYEKRDYESFKEQLKDYYISKYDKKYLVEWMSDWEEYIKKKEILDIIIKENPHEVGEEDFTITEDWVINKLLKPKTMKEFLEQQIITQEILQVLVKNNKDVKDAITFFGTE